MEHFISLLTKLNLISVSYASSIEDTPIKMSSQTASSSSGIGSFIFSIVIFFLFIAVLGYFFILLTKKNEKQLVSNKSFKVLDRIKLDHNSNLFVIQIHNTVHVLGKTDSHMMHVTKFTDSDDINIIKSDCLNKKEVTFQSVLAEQFEQVAGTQKLKSNSAKAVKINRKDI